MINDNESLILCVFVPGGAWAEKALFKTTDDGRSWKRIADSFGTIENASVPQSGYISQMEFTDEAHGWMVAARIPSLYHTRDGGR